MKKVLLALFILNAGVCFSQNISVSQASKKTAERCLKLAENYLRGGDVTAALSQTELGLGYDDSISDLYYVKAACRQMQGAPVQEVLELSKTADLKKNWSGYNDKGNRILLADLLSDTGNYDAAMDVLDREPFVFSADAEAVRVKTLYRMGSEEALVKARSKIQSARRIYKGDVRFINLFFNFELDSLLKGGKDFQLNVSVLETADVLSAEMKNYKEINADLECASIFFMEGEPQIRAVKAFDASEKKSFLFPIVALMSGVLSEEEAFERFFEFADVYTTFDALKFFSSLIESDEVRDRLYNRLNSYNGTIFCDSDGDMQNELQVVYERGRPQYIHFDADNNGIEDIYCTLDYGEILSCHVIALGTELFYSDYPFLGRAVQTKDSQSVVFEFSKNTCEYSPVYFTRPEGLQLVDKENDFYFPVIKSNWNDPASLDYLGAATFIKLQSAERPGAFVTYSLLQGLPVTAMFYSNDRVFGTADFENGYPAVRYVDYDYDGNFETQELFSVIPAEKRDLFEDTDRSGIKTCFPYFDFSEDVYLSGVLIDRENDNIAEFQEYYREKGGKTSVWLTEDGRSETLIRFPKEDRKPLFEETVFLVGIDNDDVHVFKEDGIPVKISGKNGENLVYAGNEKSFFWVGETGDPLIENEFVQRLKFVEPGVMVFVEKENIQYRLIKMGGNIFSSFSVLENEETENVESEN